MSVTLWPAAIPARQASRVSPLEALRVRGDAREGWFVQRGWLVGIILLVSSSILLVAASLPGQMRDMMVMGLLMGGTLLIPAVVSIRERMVRPGLRRIYGAEGQLGSRNVQRARLRTALTVAALMTGVAMVRASGLSRQRSARTLAPGSRNTSAGMCTSTRRSTCAPTWAPVGWGRWCGCRDTDPLSGYQRVLPEGGDERLTLMAVDPTPIVRVTSFVFSGEQGDPARLANRFGRGNTVFISSVLSEKYGLGPGDTIRLATCPRERDFEIVAVVVDFYNQGLVVQGSWKDLRRYFGVNDVSAFF